MDYAILKQSPNNIVSIIKIFNSNNYGLVHPLFGNIIKEVAPEEILYIVPAEYNIELGDLNNEVIFTLTTRFLLMVVYISVGLIALISAPTIALTILPIFSLIFTIIFGYILVKPLLSVNNQKQNIINLTRKHFS